MHHPPPAGATAAPSVQARDLRGHAPSSPGVPGPAPNDAHARITANAAEAHGKFAKIPKITQGPVQTTTSGEAITIVLRLIITHMIRDIFDVN